MRVFVMPCGWSKMQRIQLALLPSRANRHIRRANYRTRVAYVIAIIHTHELLQVNTKYDFQDIKVTKTKPETRRAKADKVTASWELDRSHEPRVTRLASTRPRTQRLVKAGKILRIGKGVTRIQVQETQPKLPPFLTFKSLQRSFWIVRFTPGTTGYRK